MLITGRAGYFAVAPIGARFLPAVELSQFVEETDTESVREQKTFEPVTAS